VVRKSVGKKPPGRSRHRWEENVVMTLKTEDRGCRLDYCGQG